MFVENNGHFESTILTDIPSGPHALRRSMLEMIAEIMKGIIFISLNRYSVQCGKLGRDIPDELVVEMKKN